MEKVSRMKGAEWAIQAENLGGRYTQCVNLERCNASVSQMEGSGEGCRNM
jgi:hypothetical protein